MEALISRAACLLPLLGTAVADVVAPPPGYRAPVIAKVQIVYSMVSHHHNIGERIFFYHNHGVPQGSTNFAVPMLVYEPLVTLYNPYHEPLTISRGVRVRLWDPPVGFRFKKNDAWLRPAFAEGTYQGLSFFNISFDTTGQARKTFTLHLTDGTPTAAAQDLTLLPGESATYAMRLEPNWKWGYETASDFSPRSVFDWYWQLNLTNIDNRTKNPGGVEAVRGWDYRAGFQTDHLSLVIARPPETAYEFEKIDSFYATSGWVTIRLTDTVTVEAAPVRTAWEPGAADFQIDLMDGRPFEGRDVFQQIKFDLASLVAHGDPGSEPAPVERTFQIGDILQTPSDATLGGKKPFAVLTAAAKTSALIDGSLTRLGTPDAAKHYDLRFDEAVVPSSVENIGPIAPQPESAKVLALKRRGDLLSVDLLSPLPGTETWRAWGGESPDAMDESLDSITETIPGPAGTWLRRVNLERTDWPERYFIQFRAEAP